MTSELLAQSLCAALRGMGGGCYATRARIDAGYRHCRPRQWMLIERPTRARPDTIVDGFPVFKLAPNTVDPVE